MGQIHGKISVNRQAQPFVNLPSKCIKQLIDAFHLIAENFNLTLSELEDIFKVSIRDSYRQSDDEFSQMSKVFFHLFDHNSSLEIDSFEVLSALIVTSDMKVKEKIEKIVDLFDFERTMMFTIHEVALAMRSTVAGMCKIADLDRPENDFIDSLSSIIFSVISKDVSVEHNQEMLKKIKVGELEESVMTLLETRRWLDLFNNLDEIHVPKLTDLPHISNTYQIVDDESFGVTPTKNAYWEDMIQLCERKEDESLVASNITSIPAVGIRLDWVYGRNTKNLSSSNGFYTSTGVIVYAAGVVGVVYQKSNDEGLESQQYYMGHTNYISCIGVSTDPDEQHGTLVATSEYCAKPQIHVWSSKTLTMLQCLVGFHSLGVQSVDFSPSRELLLTMGMDTMHSVAIYNWKLNQIIFTTQTSSGVSQSRFLYSDEKFVVCGNTFFHVWEKDDCHFSYDSYTKSHGLFGNQFKRQAITCIATWKCKILSGGRDGNIRIWEGRSCTSILETARNKSSISALFVSKDSLKVYAGTASGALLIYNECLELVVSHRISNFIKGSSCYIDSVSHIRGSNILIGIASGELLEVSEPDGKFVKFVTMSNCGAKGSVALDTSPVNSDEVATVGKDGNLRIVNTRDKSCANEVNFGAPISTANYNCEGDRIVVGLTVPYAGQILVLDTANFSIVIKSRPCNKTLLDCKHSKDGKYMAVGAENHNIYIFDAKTYDMVARATGHTSPVKHIDFGACPDNGNAISLRSNGLNDEIMFWKLDGKQISPISQRRTVFESCSCPISWDLRTLHQSINVLNVEGFDFSSSNAFSIVIVADDKGEMSICNFPQQQQQQHCVLRVQGHGGLIGNIKSSKGDNSIFSLGKYDGCLIQWKMHKRENYDSSYFVEQESTISHKSYEEMTSLHDKESKGSFAPSDCQGLTTDGKYSNQWEKNIVQPTNYTKIHYPNTPQPFIVDWVQGYNGGFTNNLFYSLDGVLIYPVGKILIFHDLAKNEQSYYQEARDRITATAMHPSFKIFALGVGMKRPEILCIDSDSLQTIQILKGHNNAPISNMKFNQTGHLLATISADDTNTISIYNWKIKTCSMVYTHTTKRSTYDLAFGTKEVLQVGQDLLRIWSIEIGSVDYTDISLDKSFLSAIPFDIGYLVGADDGFIHKLVGNKVVAEVAVCESKSPITALNSCKELTVCCSKHGAIGIFDNCLTPIIRISTKDAVGIKIGTFIRSIACHDDGHKVALGTSQNEIYELSIDSGGKMHCSGKVEGHSGLTLAGMTISPDTSICATTADDKYLRLWRLDDMQLLRSLQLHTISKCCSFSPDGKMILLGYGSSKKIFASESPGKWEILDVSTLKVLLEDRPTRKMITEIKWSEDGFIAMGSSDCKLYIYSVMISESGNSQATCLHVIGQHYSPIQHIDFSIDSKYLKVNCQYNLHFFSVEDGKYVVDASTMKDVKWKSYNCTYSWNVFGVWSACKNEDTEVNCVDVNIINGAGFLLAGFAHGDLGLFHHPCISSKCVSRPLPAHHGRVGHVLWLDTESFVSIGLEDKALIRWKIHPKTINVLKDESELYLKKDYSHRNQCKELNSTTFHQCQWEVERIKRPWMASMVPPLQDLSPESRGKNIRMDILQLSGFDGRYIHSKGWNRFVSSAGSICLIHDTLQSKQEYFKGHNSRISCMAASVNRKHLIASGEIGHNPTVKLWDINTCNEIGSLENGHSASVEFLVFTDHDHTLLSMGAEYQHFVCIWKSMSGEWHDGRLHMKVQSGCCIPSFLVAYSPGSFAIGIENEIFCWDYNAHHTIVSSKRLDINDEDKQPLSCGIRFGLRIAAGTTNGLLYLWDTENGLTSKVKAHDSFLFSLTESNDRLISVANDGTIAIWNMDLMKQLSVDLKRHPLFDNHGIQFTSPHVEEKCNNLLIGSSKCGVFEISTRTSNIVSLTEAHSSLRDCIFHPLDESVYATCDGNGTVRVWSVGGLLSTKRLKTSYECNCIDWSHDGVEIIIGCVVQSDMQSSKQAVSCILIDCETMNVKWTGNDCNDSVDIVKFSSQSQMFALASDRYQIFVYDNKERVGQSLKPRLRVLSNIHKARIRSIDFSTDAYYIQTSSDDYEYIRFNTDDGDVMTLPSQLRHIKWDSYTCHFGWHVHGIWPPVAEVSNSSPEPTCVNRSPDESLLAVGFSTGEIRLSPFPCISNKDSCYFSKKIHVGPVSKCIFNSNSTLMISLCKQQENHLIIWRLRTEGKQAN